MRYDEVRELGQELLGCRLAYEKPDMVECVCSPRHQNQKADEDGANWVNIPYDTTSNDGHSKPKGIDDDIIAVVNEEDVNRRIATKDEAICAKRTFGKNCAD